MSKYIYRAIKSFAYSSAIGAACLLAITWLSHAIGHPIHPMTPEFLHFFPDETVATLADVMLYGLFGLSFSGMSFIYDCDRIGIVWQYLIYFAGTALVWVPVITLMWQLYRYPAALISTIAGFLVAYIISTIAAYRSAKKDIENLNKAFSKE